MVLNFPQKRTTVVILVFSGENANDLLGVIERSYGSDTLMQIKVCLQQYNVVAGNCEKQSDGSRLDVVTRNGHELGYPFRFEASCLMSSFTFLGFACPPVTFITWPTKKPCNRSFPPRYSAS